MSESTIAHDELEIRPVGDELRARIRRGVDLVVLVAASLACAGQASAYAHGGASRALLTMLGTLVLAICGLAGLIGRARWTPTAYMTILVVGNFFVLLMFGPLLGMGAIYPCAITFAFAFLRPTWRWGLVVALTATPLVVGALGSFGVVEPALSFQFADPSSWARIMTASAAAMISLAVIVGHSVRQLVDGRIEIERATELERETRRERDRIELEIARTRRADLIVELAAEVGTDIGEALAVVSSRAEALARTLRSDAAQTYLAEVIAAANAAGSTMRSLTVFAPTTEDVAVRCDAAQTARALPQIVRRTIPSRIALEISADTEAWVALGATDLLRILSNLVLNARDAIAEAGSIAVRVTSDPSMIVIEVRDSGAGMDEETRARVFQPFFTTKAVGRGTGLGLATAKILVERAGGTIELASELGRGTCVTLRLPSAMRPPPHE